MKPKDPLARAANLAIAAILVVAATMLAVFTYYTLNPLQIP